MKNTSVQREREREREKLEPHNPAFFLRKFREFFYFKKRNILEIFPFFGVKGCQFYLFLKLKFLLSHLDSDF
jgi:hypothetical protein